MQVSSKNIAEKVECRLKTLEWAMDQNIHLVDPTLIEYIFSSVLDYWSWMGESDREFYEAARWASDNQKVWNNKVANINKD